MSFARSNSMGPSLFYCPITQDIMVSPVILMGDGQTYEEEPLKIWLGQNNTSPSTGAPLETKAFQTNWALKRLIQEWERNHASEQLRSVQLTRLENFLLPDGPYKDAFDLEIIAGEEKQSFSCVRGMLGVLTPFFRDLLFSEENRSKTVFELPQVASAGFEQVLRVAFNLDPTIDADNVMEVITASSFLDIPKLRDECLAYLSMNIGLPAVSEKVMSVLEEAEDNPIDQQTRDEFITLLLNRPVDGRNVITTFSSAWALKMLTPELEIKCCKIFSTRGEEVVRSQAFAYCRYELLRALVESDHFHVKEESLWEGCVKWCVQQSILELEDPNYSLPDEDEKMEEFGYTPGNAMDINGLLGLEVMEDKWRAKYISATSANFPAGAMKYLKRLIPLFRFPVMDVEFFHENCEPLLPREMSDNVLLYKVRGGDCYFNTNKRVDPTEKLAKFEVVAAFPNEENRGFSIPNPEVDSQWSHVTLDNAKAPQYFVVDCSGACFLKKAEWKNHYDDNDTIQDVDLFMLPPEVPYTDIVAAGTDHWVKIQQLRSQKSKEWQHLPIRQDENTPARYYKFQVVSTYGGGGNYTCLDHLKLEIARAQWRTYFANKLPEPEPEPEANAEASAVEENVEAVSG